MRITLIISSLNSGGAERVMSIMANYWASAGMDITLITLDSVASDFYRLHSNIKRVALGLVTASCTFRRAVINNCRRIKHLRREIIASRPEVIISFEDKTNILTLIAASGLTIPVMVSERTDPRYHCIGRFWSALRRLVYPRADAVIVQSGSVRSWAEQFITRKPVYVIPNPVCLPNVSPKTEYPLPAPKNIIAMGRLEPEKGFDLLLQAFSRCAVKHPNWSLTLFGEGSQRNYLEELAKKLGIRERTHFPGRIKEPAEALAKADLFVMSSHYEGFPNALLEAMSCGLPVISTDCPSGPREIIQNGVNGLLVPPEDIDALACAMDRLMGSPEECQRLANRAVEVNTSFGLHKVMGMWNAVIKEITCK